MREWHSAFRSAVLLASVAVTGSASWAGQSSSASASSESSQISFTGKVFDTQDKPVADANVTFYQVTYGVAAMTPTVQRVEGLVTGPDGVFVFKAPRESDAYRQGSVVVWKEGLALGWAAWEMRLGDQQFNIRLGEPKELCGVVVDEGGGPISDAEVSVALATIGNQEDHRYLMYLVAPEVLTVKTDSAGRFAFGSMPGEATCELMARKAGRATVCSYVPTDRSSDKLRFSPGQAGIKLTLPLEARVEGKVVEKSDGKPVAGVRINAQPDLRGLPSTIESVVSAVDGSFAFGNLPEGGYTLQLLQRQATADWVAESVKVNLKAGETVRDVQLALSRGGMLEVLVKEERGGKPIEKASVSIRSEASGQWIGGTSDANGVARIRLAPGNYQLTGVYKEDYARTEQAETPFTVAEGETKRMEQTLGGLPTISGVVYNDAGKPLQGAVVQVLPGGRGKDAVSDAEGRFEAKWDPQGWSQDRTVFYIVARHQERRLATTLPIEDAESKMDLKLRPATTLAGQVADPNGKAIADARLVIMLHQSNWGSSFLPYDGVKTDAQGMFETPIVPADQRYSITASAEGYGQERIEIAEEQTTAGKTQAGKFSLPVANLSVTGTVVDSQGKPVSGAQVSCNGGYEDNQPNRDTRTNAEGRFTLDRVCSGRINISAYTPNGVTNLNGYVRTEGGARDIQIVVSERSGSRAYVPRKPASLKGKDLLDLKRLGIELPADANDKMLLVCFWDMNQRPSRHCMSELIRRAPQLSEKGVTIVGIHGAQIEQAALDQWIQQSKPPFPVCGVKDKIEQTQFEWGVASLPHLILTDKKHLVVGEGFAMLGELDKRIEEASVR